MRSALSMRIIGKGRAGLESFCGVMDMLPPVTAHAYSSHLSVLAEASVQMASDNMRAASESAKLANQILHLPCIG